MPHYHGTPMLHRHYMISFPIVYKLTLLLLKCLVIQVLPLVLLSQVHLDCLEVRVSLEFQGHLVSLRQILPELPVHLGVLWDRVDLLLLHLLILVNRLYL